MGSPSRRPRHRGGPRSPRTEVRASQSAEKEAGHMIDVTHQIEQVERRVGSRTLTDGDARVLTISQAYDTTVDDLWDACTNPERIPRWFLPVSGDLRLHGHYQLEGNAGGTVEACDPPRSFAATWEAGGDISWIEVRITDNGSEGKQRATL